MSNASLQATEAARMRAGAGSCAAGVAARHLPSTKTARGANNAVAIAPCTKMARTIPGGNLLDRKNIDSIWLATVEIPYMPTNIALARSEEHTSELQSPCNLVCR